MTLSKQDAAAALSDIEQATGRGQTLRAYRSAGPVLILWGVIWIAGYVAMGLLPDQRWGWIWLWLDLIGVVASVVVSRRSGLGTMASRAAGWRGLAVAVFIGVALAIFHPKSTAP